MRFAVALLTVICIASVVGTVLRQHESVGNYINEFGPFWAELFLLLSLNNVYSAWWFLLILAFLVLSTTLCLLRHTPRYLADLKNYQENIRVKSLAAFSHRAQIILAEPSAQAAQRIAQQLADKGWSVKLQNRSGTGHMVAARAGRAHKLGYIAAHAAIVLICLGGLLDGDLMVRAQMWWHGKSSYAGTGRIAEVPAAHRLSANNPTFRANLMVGEGTVANTAVINQADGVVLQELPFALELKKFTVDYYDSGMPKLFTSEVIIHDHATGEQLERTIAVNHPINHRGIEIYQSSFDDGGSAVQLRAVPMMGAAGAAQSAPLQLHGTIGTAPTLSEPLRALLGAGVHVELDALRTINVENFANAQVRGSAAGEAATDVRAVDLRGSIERHLGAGNKTADAKALRNIGPSISYKLRDAAGQAVEYQNYMASVDFGDGQPVFLLGVRDQLNAPMRYLRIPADERDSMEGFLRLRAALHNRAWQRLATERYARSALGDEGEGAASSAQTPDRSLGQKSTGSSPSDSTSDSRSALRQALQASALKALQIFAGTAPDPSVPRLPGQMPDGGLQAIDRFLQTTVPEAERDQAAQVLLRILNGALFELAQISREHAGLEPMAANAHTLSFMTQSVFALSDVQFYPAPVAFMLQDFQHVQASVFQVARAPGKNVVYLGCALLIVGVFAMLYVRDRRLWVWVQDMQASSGGDSTQPSQRTHATMAMSSNRRMRDIDHEFECLRHSLLAPASDAAESTEQPLPPTQS